MGICAAWRTARRGTRRCGTAGRWCAGLVVNWHFCTCLSVKNGISIWNHDVEYHFSVTLTNRCEFPETWEGSIYRVGLTAVTMFGLPPGCQETSIEKVRKQWVRKSPFRFAWKKHATT
jgi:hypothetical protein